MTQELWTKVDGYIAETLIGRDGALEAALAESARAGLPEIQVSPNQGKLLMLAAGMVRAERILEIGTLGGYSTIWLARGLAPGGRLISLELNESYAGVARRNVENAGLGGSVEIRVGPALGSLAQLEAEREGPFDLVFIDADKPATPEYFGRAVHMTRPGGVIITDNVVRDGTLADPGSRDASALGMRRFLETAGADRRVRMTALQTVGSKGYDGFALAVVN